MKVYFKKKKKKKREREREEEEEEDATTGSPRTDGVIGQSQNQDGCPFEVTKKYRTSLIQAEIKANRLFRSVSCLSMEM